MNGTWLYLALAAVAMAMALDTRRWERKLSLFATGGRNRTGLCPPVKPESCDCGRFRGKNSAKYLQCATNPFCEHCAQRWST